MVETVMGYPRKEGFGIRNYILVIATVYCSNETVQQIANQTGATPILIQGGCGEMPAKRQSTHRCLLETASHPNVYGGVLVGLGCEQTDGRKLLRDLEGTGKPFQFFEIQELGGPGAVIEQAVPYLRDMIAEAGAQQRQPFPISQLVVSTQCGGSDWTTALTGNVVNGVATDHFVKHGATVLLSEVGGLPGSEHVLAKSAIDLEVANAIIDMTDARRAYYYKTHGRTIEEVNPTEGNKAGGITTLVEKSTGNVKKVGSSTIIGVLGLYDKPTKAGGVYIIDHRCLGIDAVNATAMALSGAHIQMFTTGRGTPLGHAVMPILKLTGNPNSFRQFPTMIDFNGGMAMEGSDVESTGRMLFELMLEMVNGRRTKSEQLGNREFMLLHPDY